MNAIDFFIGLTLMNAMPHFVLGVWRGRILSGLGFSPRANLGYSAINFSVASGLFVYEYGVAGLAEHGMFAGALTILVLYFFTGHLFYRLFHVRHFEGRRDPVTEVNLANSPG